MPETDVITVSKTTQANGVVKKYMLGSLAHSLIPVPWLDLVLLSGIQVKMLHRLAGLYGVPFSSQLAKSLIGALVGTSVPTCMARYFVPVVGPVLGMVGSAAFGGASTYALGKVFIQHFESGGTLLTFNPEKVRAYYKQQFEAGTTEVQSFAGVRP